MPAMPMNEAAERYSPEMAEAFQPTDTERPATKKSLAVLDVRAERKPIQTVTTTVMSEKARIHGSTPLRKARVVMASAFDGFDLFLLELDRAPDEAPRDDPHEGEEQHPEDQPAQREPSHPRRHQCRREIVQQRHAQQRDEEGRRARDGKLQLPVHERLEERLAVHLVVVGGRGKHRGGSVRI